MNLVLLYLLLFKAVVTSFSGMASLPMVRQDFVVTRHILTDRQLNTAIVAGRTGPGPNGLYLVSVGYFAAGLPGAFAGINCADHSRVPHHSHDELDRQIRQPPAHPRRHSRRDPGQRRTLDGRLDSAGARRRHGTLAAAIIVASFVVLTFTRIETWWVMVGAAAVGLGAKLFS